LIKILDLVLLFRYSESLVSCDRQFGFEACWSTDMCTMILKESVVYYLNNGSSVYCHFLDGFNASKSKCMHFCPKGYHRKIHGSTPVFFACSQPIKVVKQWSHLGHIISYDMDDRYNIMRFHDSLVKQINNVLCFFGKLNLIIKLRLLVSYCYSLYGSVLWNVCNGYVERVGSPSNAHSVFLPLLCWCLPLYINELIKRLLTFTQRCINCDNNLVKFVVRYAIWYNRMASPLGCSVFQCCSKYDFEYEDLVIEPPVYSKILSEDG